MSLVGTYTYEEGTDGAPVTTGNDRVFVSGDVTYSAAYAQQGALGILLGSASTPVVDYSIAFPHTGSVYLKRGPETPTSRVNYIVFVDSNGVTAGGIGIKKTGEWILTDSGGNILQTSTYLTAPGDVFRVDWQVNYSGGSLSWTAHFFTSPSSSTPAEALTTSAASTQPGRVRLITFSSSSLGADTLRLWDDLSVWPSPYVAGTPSATISWLSV